MLIVVAGGLLPVGYQIFRMGYYGLLVPGTALAKDASGEKWSQGFVYLANFNAPYALWVPVILLVVLGVLGAGGAQPQPGALRSGAGDAALRKPDRCGGVHRRQRTAAGALRSAGRRLHARSGFADAAVLRAGSGSVIPLVLPEQMKLSRGTGGVLAGATAAVWLAVAVWALWAANSPALGADATRVTYTGIVDERRFYAQATGKAHPLTAADYLDYPRMRAVIEAIENTPDGALLLRVRQLHPMGRGAPPFRRLPTRPGRQAAERPAYGVLDRPRHAG